MKLGYCLNNECKAVLDWESIKEPRRSAVCICKVQYVLTTGQNIVILYGLDNNFEFNNKIIHTYWISYVNGKSKIKKDNLCIIENYPGFIQPSDVGRVVRNQIFS